MASGDDLGAPFGLLVSQSYVLQQSCDVGVFQAHIWWPLSTLGHLRGGGGLSDSPQLQHLCAIMCSGDTDIFDASNNLLLLLLVFVLTDSKAV